MQLVTIIRHAKSSWKYLDLSDFDRPLGKRGMRDAPMMAKALRQLNLLPDKVLVSPSQRTRSTLSCFIQEQAFTESQCDFIDALYEASANQISQIIDNHSEIKPEDNHIALIGHNPGLTDWLNETTGINLLNLPTCAIATVEFEDKGAQVSTPLPMAPAAKLVTLLTPKSIDLASN